MINLYSEIKNYVVRIKTLLGKTLEHEISITNQPLIGNNDDEMERDISKIISYLITLGEEKVHLKQLFLKLKVQSIKKQLVLIVREKKEKEILPEVYRRIEHGEISPD